MPTPRFRDSWLIRIGIGIIAFWVMVFLVFAGAEWFGHKVDMWPTNLWMMFWIVIALFLIIIGIGQTIVRRRSQPRG